MVEAATAPRSRSASCRSRARSIGPIAETHDLLYGSPLSIVREATLAIRTASSACRGAIARAARGSCARIRPRSTSAATCSRPRACRRVAAATTADAAREVATPAIRAQVAIASPEAAETYGLDVLAEDVGDRPGAFTRFVALAPYTQVARGERLAHRALVRHRPPAGRALPRARRRSPAATSTSCSSSRGRSRTRRGATASTSCSTATSSTSRRPRARRAAHADPRAAPVRLVRGGARAMSRRCFARSGTRTRRRAAGRAVAALGRPPPRARGDEPAGVRGAAPGRPPVRRPDLTVATMDHNVPTVDGPITDPLAKRSSTRCAQLRRVRCAPASRPAAVARGSCT